MSEEEIREGAADGGQEPKRGQSGSARRAGSRPSVKASGARMATSSGQPRQPRTRTTARRAVSSDGSESAVARTQRPSVSGARQGEAHHHLLRNTTYSRPSADSSSEGDGRAPRRSSAGAGASGSAAAGAAKDAAANAAARAKEALGAAGERVDGLLSNLPFPKSYVYIALAAIVVAVVIGLAVSTCSAPAVEEGAGDAQEGQAEQQDGADADIPEELRWRDADFAVDPARTSWKTSDNGRKVVYLTIDDGPSELTERFLDMLDEHDAKATFFVTGHDPQYYPLIREAYRRGHTIGLHSMTHDYPQVYASEDAFFSDLDAVGQVVKDQIGYVPCFTRFPGGSSNTQADGYSKGIMPKLTEKLQAQGYQYYDWNADTGDGANLTKDQIIEAVKSAELDTNIILLCHDSATKEGTLEALPEIIEYYQNLGYTFEAIDRDTWVCHHVVYQADDSEGASSATSEEGEAANETGADEYAASTADAEGYDEGGYYEEPAEEEAYGDTYADESYDDGYAEDDGEYEEA